MGNGKNLAFLVRLTEGQAEITQGTWRQKMEGSIRIEALELLCGPQAVVSGAWECAPHLSPVSLGSAPLSL